MNCRWLRTAILLVAVIVFHDADMAASGQDMSPAAPIETCVSSDIIGHHQRHHGDQRPALLSDLAPVELPEGCDAIRDAVSLNRVVSQGSTDSPTTLQSDITIQVSFTAISRTLAESPPPRPSDMTRALFQVYRI